MASQFDVRVRYLSNDHPAAAVTVKISPETDFTVYDLKMAIHERLSDNLIPQRQELYVGGVKLELDHKPIQYYDIKECSTVHLHDKGFQLPKRPCKLLVYLGPMLIMWIFSAHRILMFEYILPRSFLNHREYSFVNFNEGATHRAAKLMINVYFMKLVVETLAIHRLAGRMMSVKNFFWQVLGYWVCLALCVGYSLYHPDYTHS